MLEPKELNQRLLQVKLFACDVDGVLTDGGIYHGSAEELKRYDSRDGAALKFLMQSGITVAWITGRTSQSVSTRAQELGIDHLIQGAEDKGRAFQELLLKTGLRAEQAVYMGDDLMDLAPMSRAGMGIAVADAAEDVIRRAAYVTRRNGGYSAVREAAEMILKAQGKWDALVESYLVQKDL